MLPLLPVQNPEQLVQLLSLDPGEPRTNGFSWQTYEHFRDNNHVFSGLIGADDSRSNVRGEGLEPETVNGEYVVGSFFPVLGIKPVIGRLIGPEDDHLGSADSAVAVIAWSYWKTRFNFDPGILGKRMVDDVPLTVVGVTRVRFRITGGTQARHLGARGSSRWSAPQSYDLGHRTWPDGTIEACVSINQARAEMTVLNQWRSRKLRRQ
jgi:hypothetical protein